MKDLKKHASKVGLLLVVLYAVYLVWRVFLQDSAATTLHLAGLKMAFPGFKGYDVLSILWGAVLTFIYGFVGSWIFYRLHKNCCEPK